MKKTLIALLSLGIGAAHAQEAPEQPGEEAADEAAASLAEIAALQAELAAAQQATASEAAARAAVESLLTAAATLTDRQSAEVDRIAAISTIAEIGDPRGVPFLKLAADRGSAPVKIALLDAAARFPDDERIHRMVLWLVSNSHPESVRLAAIPALDAAGVPEAAECLLQLASSRDEPESVRAAATAQLQENHAAFLAERNGIQMASRPADTEALLLFTGTSGVAGGLLLASVGQLGQTEAGAGIGAIGGTLIGAGTGLLYARSNELNVTDSLQYTTAAGWGMLTGGQLAFLTQVDQPLYLLTLGSTVGAGIGLLAIDQLDPSSEDVFEVTGAMLLGNQALAGAARWAEATDEGRIGMGMLGQGLGLAAGMATRSAVELDTDDSALIASAGLVGGWLGAVAPLAVDAQQYNGGSIQTAIPVAMIAATTVSQLSEVPMQQTLTADYGFLSGNLLGLGLPLLLTASPDGSVVPQSVLAGGVAGTVAGATLYDRFTVDSGDATFIAVGTGLATAEAAALSYVLSEKIGFDREPGLIVTTTGASLVGLGLASQAVTVEPGAPLLVGSAAGWGVFYGGLFPVALGLEGQPDDLILAVTLTSDLFMAGAALTQGPRIDLDPRATVLPQLGGVGGSVVGTLVPALVTQSPQSIAAGALIGSGAGVAVGIALERRYGSQWIPRAASLPDVRLVSAPAVIDRDETGMTFGVAVEGW